MSKGDMWTQTCTQRTRCEDEGRGWGDASSVMERQRRPANPQELGTGPEQVLPPSLKGSQSCPHLTPHFSLQTRERLHFCCVSCQFVVLCCGSPRKLTSLTKLLSTFLVKQCGALENVSSADAFQMPLKHFFESLPYLYDQFTFVPISTLIRQVKITTDPVPQIHF